MLHGFKPHRTVLVGSWRRFPGQNDPFPPKSLESAFTAISGEIAVLKRTRMPQDATFPTGRCDRTPGFTTSSNLVG